MSLLPSARHQFLYFALCLFGLLLAASGLLLIIGGISTAYWPSTTGKILSSTFITPLSPKSSGAYLPEITYEYNVHNASYTSSLARIGGLGFPSESKVEQYLADKSPGAPIPVYYCPLAPALSVLERGPTLGAGIVCFVGLSFFLGFRLLGKIASRRSFTTT